MQLLASGRDAAIYDLGDGRVLRRCHKPRSMELELVRAAFLDEFLDRAGRRPAAALLPAVAARKLGDPNIRESERRAIHGIVADEAGGRLRA